MCPYTGGDKLGPGINQDKAASEFSRPATIGEALNQYR